MDLSSAELPDLYTFTPQELQRELKKLFSKYRETKSLHDEKDQEIYNLKRNLQTSTAAESYLTQEIEFLLNNQNAEIVKVKEKYSKEIDEIKSQYARIQEHNAILERQVEDLQKEIVTYKQVIEKMKYEKPPDVALERSGSSDKELQLEKENLDLLVKIDQLQHKERQSIMVLAESERQMEVLQEELQCVKENLNAKKEELEEKTNILESTQERMTEMNAELAVLKSQPENENRKGNSLFAEVDDQRKAMMKILSEQKKKYLHMKKIFTESEHEIRKLKRENAAMQKELRACASIFLNSEKMFIAKLHERIKQLLEQNENLESKLNWTEQKLNDLSKNKGINWLESMLEFCRNETKKLKTELHSCRLQSGILDSNLRNLQQELAKWRFEALRLRCIIVDRENVLTENGIKFKDISALKIHITEAELEKSSPQITSQVNETSFENYVNHCNKENDSFRENQPILRITSNSEKEIPEDYSHLFVSQKTHQNIVNKIEFSQNSFMSDEQHIEVPCGVHEDNFEANDSHKNRADEKKERSENISFEIYEDTTQCLPVIRTFESARVSSQEKPHFDISISENTFRKLKELGHEYNASGWSPVEAKNKLELGQSVLPPYTNSFQIYEDTTEQAPLVRASGTESKYPVESDAYFVTSSCSDEINENRSNVADVLFSEDESQTIKSILVKKRDIFSETSKSVMFDENTKDNVNNGKLRKSTKSTNRVLIKRIAIASRSKNE